MNKLHVQSRTGFDRFALQRLALQPLISEGSLSEKRQITQEIAQLGVGEFINFLHANALQQLWRQYLQNENCSGEFSETLEHLKKEAFNAAANAINEEHQLRMVFQCFEQHSLPAFIFKGGQLRRSLYADPTLRPVSDIDLFVGEDRKLEAVRLLTELGFELKANEATVSHEASFIKNRLCIDLHWHLFRPGRIRTDLSPFLFENREKFAEGLWGLNPTASLLVMLIHPAFTKHLASPDSMLIHMVDLFRLLDQAGDNWQQVREVLEQSGTKTAAWSSLVWLYRLSGQDSIAELAREIQPKYLHKCYLDCWINHDLVNRWFAHRGIIRFGFSLALQDSTKDAVRAVYSLRQSRMLAKKQLDQLRYQSTD